MVMARFFVHILLTFLCLRRLYADEAEKEHSTYIEDFSSLVSTSMETLLQSVGLGESCPWNDNMMKSVAEVLPKNVRGQDEGVSSIVNAIAGWEMQKKSGQSRPLVMAITGSTGVGKSETSHQLADALLAKKVRVGNTRRYMPEGLLVLRGEDYSPESSITLQEAHQSIRSNLVSHLKKCGSRGVIVFDEVQKVMPGTLDVLMPAFEERGAIIEYNDTTSGTGGLLETLTGRAGPEGAVRHSTAECIFLFISDIGSARMIKLLLKHGDRASIPRAALRNEVKAALDEPWARLIFGQVVNEVVPFLPMEQSHVQEVLRVKLRRLDSFNKGKWWSALVVDDNVVAHLAGPHYLKYVNFTSKAKIAPNTATTQRDLNVDGTSSLYNEDKSRVMASKVVAKYGARALENGGPLQDLRALIFTTMQPWRPHQVLHVGLVDPSTHSFTATQLKSVEEETVAIRTAEPGSRDKLYLQWCKLTASEKDVVGTSLSEGLAFSTKCETVYVGSLFDLA